MAKTQYTKGCGKNIRIFPSSFEPFGSVGFGFCGSKLLITYSIHEKISVGRFHDDVLQDEPGFLFRVFLNPGQTVNKIFVSKAGQL